MSDCVCQYVCVCVCVLVCVYWHVCVYWCVCVCWVSVDLRFSVVVLNSGPQAPALYRFLFQPGPTKQMIEFLKTES